jgi:hypothetical protein
MHHKSLNKIEKREGKVGQPHTLTHIAESKRRREERKKRGRREEEEKRGIGREEERRRGGRRERKSTSLQAIFIHHFSR